MHRRFRCYQILSAISLLLIGTLTHTAYARKHAAPLKRTVHYAIYNNARFGYSVEYPLSVLKPQPESENGDGRRFDSPDGAIDMRIWGQYNVLNRSVKDECDTEINSISGNPKITYKRIGKSFYAFSGTKGNTVYYVYAIYRSEKYITMRLVYTSRSAPRINPYLQHIVKSIKG